MFVWIGCKDPEKKNEIIFKDDKIMQEITELFLCSYFSWKHRENGPETF